jgi:hypothetical protein
MYCQQVLGYFLTWNLASKENQKRGKELFFLPFIFGLNKLLFLAVYRVKITGS